MLLAGVSRGPGCFTPGPVGTRGDPAGLMRTSPVLGVVGEGHGEVHWQQETLASWRPPCLAEPLRGRYDARASKPSWRRKVPIALRPPDPHRWLVGPRERCRVSAWSRREQSRQRGAAGDAACGPAAPILVWARSGKMLQGWIWLFAADWLL